MRTQSREFQLTQRYHDRRPLVHITNLYANVGGLESVPQARFQHATLVTKKLSKMRVHALHIVFEVLSL